MCMVPALSLSFAVSQKKLANVNAALGSFSLVSSYNKKAKLNWRSFQPTVQTIHKAILKPLSHCYPNCAYFDSLEVIAINRM
jgi:hypothetical protein